MTAAAIAFSVIVPTRNRPTALGRCLESLAHVDYPRDQYEVLVVDDGGTISPRAVVDAVSGDVRVRLLTRAHAGPAAARNAGAAEAAHPFLAFIDDDCRADAGWLAALARVLSANAGRMVGGRVINALAHNPFADASQTLISYLYDYFNRDTPRFFCSNNLAADRATFLAVGGFDASFPFAAGEDRDLCDRWHFAHHPMCYAPDALVYHSHDLDLRGFWRQHLRYGRAAAHYHELFASRRGREVTVEPPHFYLNLVRRPFRDGMPRARALACSGLLVLSQIANAGGFAYERYRRGRTR
jgi:glycosyltransferase involved in cell wall biosynthesis